MQECVSDAERDLHVRVMSGEALVPRTRRRSMMPDDGADQTNLIEETLSSNTSQRVQLNVGGNVSFDFTQSALQSEPESMLAYVCTY